MIRIFRKNEKARLVKRLFGFRWFGNLRIGVKLTLSFAMVALIAGVIGLVGTMNIYRISRAGQQVYQENIAVLGPLHNISAQLLKVRLNTAYHVMETKDKFRYENAIKASKRNINQQLADFEKGEYKIGQRLTSLTNAFKLYWQEEAVVLELSNENKTAEATEHINQNLNSLATLIDSIMSGLFDMSNKDGKDKTEANRIAANQTIGFMLVMVLIGIIAALGLGLVISRMISKPLKQLTTAAEQVAAGDLNVTITPIDAKDETAALTNSFANMTNSLHQLVSGINEDSQTLDHASRELKNAASDTGKSAAEVAKTMEELARASSEQASQNNEAVNSINDLAEMVRQVSSEVNNIVAESQNVSEIAKLGQKATRDVAEEIVKIYDMTRDVTGVITELDQATAEISSITDIIQGVAEQTALLALNASIEAARAGEHGRGFGVVATETGKLAEQTKQAAQLISDGLTKISQRSRQVVQSMDNGMAVVESGKNLAADATVTFGDIFQQLDNILKRIDRVAYSAQNMATRNEGMIAIITNIAALSQESMAGTEEVSASTEEQSASVEQVNAMAENLAVISGKLQQTVAQFKIS